MNLKSELNATNLNERILTALEPFMFSRKVKRKETLLNAGEKCKDIYIVKTGAVKQFYISDGKEFIQNFYFEGQMACMYNSFLTQTASESYLEAIEGTELMVLSYHNFKAISDASPEFTGHMAILMSEMNMQRVNLLLMSDGMMRYRKFLEEEPEMINRVPHYMIASYLGMTPETLSRIRRKVMKRAA